ncbi:GNAT family N-acetyltransferase, partial [Nocardia sp. NPDC049149]|uniref:GNAT family N-acetyltransferase n=1 Tax=Nocardia sp. NPDC049149 TaxID=3364315 RepID=UPI003713A3E3
YPEAKQLNPDDWQLLREMSLRKLADPETKQLNPDDDWQLRREMSLRKLTDTPWAYKTTYEESEARSEQFWRDQIAHRTSTIVVFRNGEPVGDIGALPSEDRPGAQEIIAMWVDPKARGSGVSDELLETQLQCLQDNGHRQAQLWTREDNVAMRHVAERHGFTVTGNTRTHPNTDIPSIELIRDLL